MIFSVKEFIEMFNTIQKEFDDELVFDSIYTLENISSTMKKDNGFIREHYSLRHLPNKKCLIYKFYTPCNRELGYNYKASYYDKNLEIVEISESGNEWWLEDYKPR